MSKISVTTIAGLTSGGDANTVKIESGDDFVVDTDVLKVDSSNNRVGIGTASPLTSLHVNGGTMLDGITVIGREQTIYDSAGAEVMIDASGTTDPFLVHAAGSEVFRVHDDGGISFNGENTAANRFDDYEDGTWTPSCGTPGVSGSYSVQLGRYIKIGNFCHLIFNLTINSAYTGSTSSSFTIGGLPFATKAYDNSLYAGGHIGYYFNINHTDSGRTLVYQIPSGSSLTMELKGVGDNIGEQLVSPAMMGTNAVIRGSISYHTV